jgi:hypothetical protein
MQPAMQKSRKEMPEGKGLAAADAFGRFFLVGLAFY